MKVKKLLSILISATMLLSGITAVSAEDTAVATIGDESFTSLEDTDTGAFAAACKGENKTIVLQADASTADTMHVLKDSGDIILDLNGHTITSSADPAIRVWNGGSLTIIDTVGTGVIKATKSMADGVRSGSGDNYKNTENEKAKLVINGGTIDAAYSVFAVNDTDVELNGGVYTGWIYTNGTYKNSNITINGGEFKKMVYLAAGRGSIYEINGGHFETADGSTAVEIKQGTLTVNGGKFVNISSKTGWEAEPSGSSSEGYALAAVAQYAEPATVTVNGGTFDGAVGLVKITTINSTLTIKGGSYVNDISEYTAEGYTTINIEKKYGVAEKKETTVNELTDETAKASVKAGLEKQIELKDNTSEKTDTFELSKIGATYLIRATYPVSSEDNKSGSVDVDFNFSNAEINGNAMFGVIFYNIPAGIMIGTPEISIAR